MNSHLHTLKKKYWDGDFLLTGILESAGAFPGEYKTRILMKTEMNHIQIQRYFKDLEDNGMLKDPESKRWFRTEKGDAFLDTYNKINENVNL